jgi:SSS family solute:Na+ symporter/sodium/pantothenate symporter
LRYSIIYLTIYNSLIYVPLVFIFVAARTILPNLASSDDVMPSLVIKLADPYTAGLILAAPYGAVLSTVSGWLLIVSSGLVHDLYQRFLRPTASEREIAWASYSATVAVGLVAAAIATHPPRYLQLIIVFSATGMASAFLMPALLGAFWRRTTAAGAIAAMVTGVLVTLTLYVLGSFSLETLGVAWLVPPNPPIGAGASFGPYYLLGFDPCIWGLSSSLFAGVVGSLLSRPPDEARVAMLFDAPGPEHEKGGK